MSKSLISYLSYSSPSSLLSRSALPKGVVFVIGNRSCDLDSVFSSVSLAYFYKHLYDPFAGGDAASDNGTRADSAPEERIFVPVLNCVKGKDFDNKHDLNLMMKNYQIDAGDLWDLNHFVDYVKSNDGVADVCLVDHNRLDLSGASNCQIFATADKKESEAEIDKIAKKINILSIHDHHVDEGDGKSDSAVEKHIRVPTGSCCSVVYGYVKAALKIAPTSSIPENLSYCILITVYVDTNGMDESSGKVTQADRECVNDMLSSLNITHSDALKLYQAVVNARFDVGLWKSFTLSQSIKMDYKLYNERVGVSSVLLGGEDVLLKECDLDIVDVGVDCVLLMCVKRSGSGSGSGGVTRELLLLQATPDAGSDDFNSISRFIEANEELDATLCREEVRWRRNVKVWKQGNAKISRKLLLPMLREANI